jgi:2-polyprenyl-3-methyl-5-hydroxy-6-metoxy-1,4-benzoquinol methylase
MEITQKLNNSISDEEVSKYWNENASKWSEYVRKGWDLYREYFNNPAFFDFIGDLSGKTVLDAGCGEGYNTRILAKQGVNITGIDISEEQIKCARKLEKKDPYGIQYIKCSFSDLSIFNQSSFDVVVSFMALMDGPNYELAISEIFRVLRPGGNLIFSITHPCFITKGMEWLKDGDGNPSKLAISDYFTKNKWLEEWTFSKAPNTEDLVPFKVPRFPRTLSDYLNQIIDCGFVIRRLQEPRPSVQMCKEHSWLNRWRDHASLFFYIHAQKTE